MSIAVPISRQIANERVGKTCRECNRDRPVSRFLPVRHTADGLSNRCLDCVLTEAQRNRQQREARRACSSKRSKFSAERPRK